MQFAFYLPDDMFYYFRDNYSFFQKFFFISKTHFKDGLLGPKRSMNIVSCAICNVLSTILDTVIYNPFFCQQDCPTFDDPFKASLDLLNLKLDEVKKKKCIFLIENPVGCHFDSLLKKVMAYTSSLLQRRRRVLLNGTSHQKVHSNCDQSRRVTSFRYECYIEEKFNQKSYFITTDISNWKAAEIRTVWYNYVLARLICAQHNCKQKSLQ